VTSLPPEGAIAPPPTPVGMTLFPDAEDFTPPPPPAGLKLCRSYTSPARI